MDLDDILDDCFTEEIDGLHSPLFSDESTKISLEAIRNEQAGLNKHRQSLLNRVPDQNSWASLKLNSVEDKDIAYLSAATGDEFALLRGKNEDILFHGTPRNCHLEQFDTIMELLNSHKITLEIHSHPDKEKIYPSMEDRLFIASYGQNSSKIISSYTGKIIHFSKNMFDDIL